MVYEFVDIVRSNKNIQSVNIQNFSFKVYPGVFSPVHSSDTAWFAEKIIPLVKGKSFLEIGSGTGVIACLAALNNAQNVVATDINPVAIENISLNSKNLSLKLSIREGSTFDPINSSETFDLIFWNHPFYFLEDELDKNDLLTASVCDSNYKSLIQFFKNGKKHLNPNGLLLLGTSNVGRINLIKKIAREQGYKYKLLEITEVPVFKGKTVKMDLRIYAFESVSN